MAIDKTAKSNIAPEKIISFILAVICCGAALYMMIILYIKYAENLDSSQLSMKEFNQSPTGRYPTFTFCIYGEDGVMFNGRRLGQKYGVSKKDFYDFLSGEKEIDNLTQANIDFDEIILGVDNILSEFSVEDDVYMKYNEWDSSIDVKKIPLISKYHDPTTNCYDYTTPFDPSITLNTLKLKFNITKVLEIFEPFEELKMYFQAHYPGQMVRNMQTYLFKIADWHLLGFEHKNNKVTAQFPGVTLMRYRENALEPCDPKLIDDDTEWKKYVISKIGCTPTYWNKNNGSKVCNSAEDLQEVKLYWPMDGGKLSKSPFRYYTKPCNKMSIFNNINRVVYKDPDILRIKFVIREALYQEVLNTRRFGVDDLWGNIGGYVGIFCGYSILQGAVNLVDILIIMLRKFLTIGTF